MHELVHTVLPILERVVPAAVGCFTYSVAFLMYKDERDKWQNRLDAIWVEIYERAKRTGSLFTALINNVALRMEALLSSAFGAERLSLKLVTVSTSISLVSYLIFDYLGSPEYGQAAYDGFIRGWQWLIILTSFTILAIATRKTWIHWLCFVVVVLVIVDPVIGEMRIGIIHEIVAPEGVMHVKVVMEGSWWDDALAILVSLATDVFAIVVIKRQLRRLTAAVSVRRVMRGVGVLAVLAIGVIALPNLLAGVFYMDWNDILGTRPALPAEHLPPGWTESLHPYVSSLIDHLYVFFDMVSVMNLTTCIYAILPCLLLISLVLHRSLWPSLARFTYPLLDFKVLSERKYLIPIGTAAFGIAFGYATIADLAAKYLKP